MLRNLTYASVASLLVFVFEIFTVTVSSLFFLLCGLHLMIHLLYFYSLSFCRHCSETCVHFFAVLCYFERFVLVKTLTFFQEFSLDLRTSTLTKDFIAELIVRSHNLLLPALVWLQSVELFLQVFVLAV